MSIYILHPKQLSRAKGQSNFPNPALTQHVFKITCRVHI